MVRFFKQETVPCAAFALAAVSMFFKHPDKEYLGYADFRTLAILCCLMSVMAELQKSSMLTPIGNPQNLYLYGKAGLSLGNFVLLMLPYASVALAVILVWGLVQSRAYHGPVQVSFSEGEKISGSKVQLALYAVLNVPAALLLSGFTENLSTPIASMASLISYKLTVREERQVKGTYFRYFTVANRCFLVVLLMFAMVLGG